MSDSFRRQSANVLGRHIDSILRLPDKTAVIAQNPTDVTDYPRVAIWLEKFSLEWTQEDELGVDAAGNLKIGALRDLQPDAGPAQVGPGLYLSSIGTLRGSGRIWVGCRLAPQREKIETKITRMFAEDPNAIGRITLFMDEPKLDALTLPWKWPVSAFAGDSIEWSQEYAFSERLWSWTDFTLDTDMLIARGDPRIGTLVLALAAETGTKLPTGTPTLTGSEQFSIAADGTITQYH